MSIKLVDFKDIVDAILEELKLQASDTVSVARIKRMINEVYINEVVPAARWKWLEGHTKVRFKEAYSSGTANMSPNSATVTLSVSTPASVGSLAGYYFSTNSLSEVYIISAHTAETATLTLSSPYLGQLDPTATFKIWTDKVALPTDCRETVTVWHNMHNKQMDAMGWQKFRELSILAPKAEGYPRVYYTGDYVGDVESTRYRELRIHPAIYSTPVTISIDYIKEVSEMTLDGDEPALPLEDRIVLKYGALATAWRTLMRNPEEAAFSYQEFQNKLNKMMGKIEDSHDKPQIHPDSLYIKRRRAPRYRVGSYSNVSGSGGGSTTAATSFLQDVIIQGGRITANITVDTGITIDGVDISVLEADFAAHLTDSIDAHDASAISVVPVGNLAADDVQEALEELQDDIDALSSGIIPKTSVTLTDNTSNGTAISIAHATYKFAQISYSIARSTTAYESGIITVVTDGSTAAIAQGAIASIGSSGVTFDVTVSGANVLLRYTTTSTGNDATMKYSLDNWA